MNKEEGIEAGVTKLWVVLSWSEEMTTLQKETVFDTVLLRKITTKRQKNSNKNHNNKKSNKLSLDREV